MNAAKLMSEQVEWVVGHVPEERVRLDVHPSAACETRDRTSSRARRCWTEEVGSPQPRRCGRLSHDACPRCKVTATASRISGWTFLSIYMWLFSDFFMQFKDVEIKEKCQK